MFKLNKEKCIGCGVCLNSCPVGAISMDKGKAEIDGNKCVNCGRCVQVCPAGAIYSGAQSRQDISSNQGQIFPGSGFGMGKSLGRGMGRGMGKGLGRGPRDGRGGGRGGGGRRG